MNKEQEITLKHYKYLRDVEIGITAKLARIHRMSKEELESLEKTIGVLENGE